MMMQSQFGAMMPFPQQPFGGVPRQPASLYIGNLDEAVHEESLYAHFSRYGPVHSLKIVKDKSTGKSKGFGYINFINPKDAESARVLSNNEKIGRNPVRLMYKADKSPANPEGNLFVKNIDRNITQKELSNFFSTAGVVTAAKVPTDDEGKSLGYGYVQYEKAEDASSAIEKLNGQRLGEQEINVALFVPRSQRASETVQRNLYVRNFPLNKTEAEIKELIDAKFNPFGKVVSKAVRQHENKWSAFVCYEKREEAQEALDKLNGNVTLEGAEGPLEVFWHQTKRERRKQQTNGGQGLFGKDLFLKNLSTTINNEQLKQAFTQFGEVTSVTIKEPNTQPPLNAPKTLFGFVVFKNVEDAKRAESDAYTRPETTALFVGRPFIVFKQSKEQREEYKKVRNNNYYNARPQRRPFNAELFNMPPQPYGGMGYMPMMPGRPNNFAQQQRGPYHGGALAAPQGGMGNPNFNQGQQHNNYQHQPQDGSFPRNPMGNRVPGGKAPYQPNNRGPGGAPQQNNFRAGQQRPGGYNNGNQQGGRAGGVQNNQQQRPQQQNMKQEEHKGDKHKEQSGDAPQLTVQNLKEKLDDFLKLDADKQRNILGELLYPKILQTASAQLAPKVTGMLVDFDVLTVQDILEMLEDDGILNERITEAVELIEQEGSQ